MPNWSFVANEIANAHNEKYPHPYDTARQKYLADLHAYTNRNVIVYYLVSVKKTRNSLVSKIIPLRCIKLSTKELCIDDKEYKR